MSILNCTTVVLKKGFTRYTGLCSKCPHLRSHKYSRATEGAKFGLDMAELGWRWKKKRKKKEETSDPVQHACRTTVLGLSRFKCAANFDVIFFPSHCLKPLALFIIRALWSEQHGNNVSRRHTPSDGPLTALCHLFLSFFPPLSPFPPLSFCLLSQSSHFFRPFVGSPSLSSP